MNRRRNLFTKDNNVDINKGTDNLNYFRGEDLIEKINNKEILFSLATRGGGDDIMSKEV